ncbi:MAG TPA: cytochrome c oxidase subunit II [Gemmatimonadaceae bacterium]|nr:cytochrome c oxidase subunit II [Gemmatimonadaceae bacterium]
MEEHRPRPDRRTIGQMVACFAVITAIGILLGNLLHWFPRASSTQAVRIGHLWDVLVAASAPMFGIVATGVIFSVWKWRMRPGEENLDGPSIHGNTRLEVFWTAVPALMLVSLCSYSYIVLHNVEKAPAAGHERVVDVTGQQFAWTFTYHEQGKTFNTTQLYLPAGQSVKFRLHAKDVIHDFWVPDFRMKLDAVPGITGTYRITPRNPQGIGDHDIVCAELCGLGHAYMRSVVHVMRPAAFGTWLSKEITGGAAGGAGAGSGAAGGAGAGAGAGAVNAKQLFVAGNTQTGATACGACHTLAAAGTSGTTGPDLDKVLKGRNAAFVKQSIVDPNAYITPGYGANIMPPNFAKTLSPAQIDALVQYLVKSTSKK